MSTGRRRPLFTEEELEEMRRADAEVEADFRLTQEDIAFSRNADREAKLSRKDPHERKIAENQRAYREANREKYNAYMREYQRKQRAKRKAASRGANTESSKVNT